jgi:phosphopantothenoylcysteine synthetase/decarboxylase
LNILLTAGNTHARVDRLKILTNVFTGPTSAEIARTAYVRRHQVTVLTSQPYTLYDLPGPADDPTGRASVLGYQTFDELAARLQHEVRNGGYDCVIHTAAVSDYLSAGVYVPDPGTFFNARARRWERAGPAPTMTEQKDGKLNGSEPELWLRLVRAPRLIDRFRRPWGFDGLLVAFKMEVGLTDPELVEAAEQTRTRCGADLTVASTLEGSAHFAYLGPADGNYDCVPRRELAERLMLALEHLQRSRGAANG